MASWSFVTLSTLENGRMDADFYHPVYLGELELWDRLNERIGVSKLNQLISEPVRTGRTPRIRTAIKGEKCVRFIKTDTVREGWIDFGAAHSLPARVVSKRDLISNECLVITIIGATPEIVGRTAIVRATDPECVTNQNVAVISVNDAVDPFYLTAYFQTKLGRDQLWRHSRRTEQVNLNCREVERVLVLTPREEFQTAIGSLVRKSFECADESVNLYKIAEGLFESHVEPSDSALQRSPAFTAQISEIHESDRIDADYFQPQFRETLTSVKKSPHGFERLLACCTPIRPNFLLSPDEGNEKVSYIELSDIDSSIGIVNHVPKRSISKLPSRARRRVNEGDVIASAVIGSLDKAALIGSQQNEFIASTGFFHFRPLSVSPEYLLILVRSECVRLQFRQQATGGILSAVPDTRLNRVFVPRMPGELRDEITKNLSQAHALRMEGWKLLEAAEERISELIAEAMV